MAEKKIAIFSCMIPKTQLKKIRRKPRLSPCTKTTKKEEVERQTCPLARSISNPTHAVNTPTPLRQEDRHIAFEVDEKKSSIQKDDTKGPLGWRERRINLTPEHLPQKKTWIIQKRRRRRNGKIKGGEGREARLSEAEEPRDEYTSRHGTSKLQFPHLLAVSPPRPTKKEGQPK